MKEKIEQRLRELKRDFDAGGKQMSNLEERMKELRDTMLRISGAIQVLEDLQRQALGEQDIVEDEGLLVGAEQSGGAG